MNNGLSWGSFVLTGFHALQHNELKSIDYKVFFHLCENISGSNNNVYIRSQQIADSINYHKSNVSVSVKKLLRYQLIVKIPNGFMINPYIFYIGTRMIKENQRIFDELVEARIAKNAEKEKEDKFLQKRFYYDSYTSNSVILWE